MVSKTFVTAFVATYLMAGSSASPCKVSSTTTEVSTTTDASTTVVSVETTAATGKGSSTAEDVTTTALSSIVLSSTEQLSVTATVSESSVETTLATTTIIVVDSTSTEAESTVTSNESVATATATTTTAEAPSTPTFIVNAGFEDSSESVSPWTLYYPRLISTLSLDTGISHDGQNSARIDFPQASVNAIEQELQGPITAGVSYTMSAWVRTTIGCYQTYLECGYQGDESAGGNVFQLDPDVATEWKLIAETCSFSQEQIDLGDLYMLVGFGCRANSKAYADTVSFTIQ